jgi:hypothetical protein
VTSHIIGSKSTHSHVLQAFRNIDGWHIAIALIQIVLSRRLTFLGSHSIFAFVRVVCICTVLV